MVQLRFQLHCQENGRAELGESPCWNAETGELWWVDITGQKILRTDAQATAIDSWATPEQPGFVVLMESGHPAVGMETGIYRLDPETGSFDRLIGFDRAGERFNDATVDALGRLWVSTMAMDASPGAAEIYRVTENRTLAPVIRGLSIPNGLAVDMVHERFYYSDSHADSQTIWVCPLPSGASIPMEPRVFATTKALDGRPDGAAVDTQGNYWIAGVDGSALYVFDADGNLIDTVAVPFPAPTKIGFYGDTGRRVVVTSKGIGEQGGFLATADLPDACAAGIVQPRWQV